MGVVTTPKISGVLSADKGCKFPPIKKWGVKLGVLRALK